MWQGEIEMKQEMCFLCSISRTVYEFHGMFVRNNSRSLGFEAGKVLVNNEYLVACHVTAIHVSN